MMVRFVSPGGQVETREIDDDAAVQITTGDEVSAFGRAWWVGAAVVHLDPDHENHAFVRVLLENL